MQKSKKQNTFIIAIFLLSLVALFLAFKNFFLDIIKFQIANNTEGMTNYIIDKGIIAPILIVGIEAMQMICVFISVDFLQTAIGMTYPWYIAALICLIGATLGSIIIYFLVHFLKFDSSMFKKNYKKVKIIDKKNTQRLMYLLFITPIVPLGFICYYGATQKISFRRYLFTCITGALPDIIVAVALGNFIKYALINDLPIWAIILIVLCALGLLFLLCEQLFKRFQKYSGKGTPNSRVYTTLFTIFKTITKNKPVYDISQTFDFDGPFIILSNHPSFYDVYYICETIDPIRPAFILNRFYFRNKWLKKILNRMGTIPKRIFQPDIETIKKSMKTIKNGYPVYMCPEGRLSVDGTNYEITIETAKFIKQNKVPVVIINIQGAYLVKPKWRKKQIKGEVRTNVHTIITKDDIETKSLEEITSIINEGIKFNDFEYAKENNITYKNKNKALGLENILYYCPKCHKEHVLETKGNTISCKACGFKLEIDEHYWFKENELNIKNIHEWYQIIKEYEFSNIKNKINHSCEVRVKKYNLIDEKLNEEGTGICYLNNQEFSFEGNLKVGKFTHQIQKLSGLAFSSGEEFECYYDNELYYFYPLKDKSVCAKWALLVDELQKTGDFNE